MDDVLVVLFDAKKAGREAFKGPERENYSTITEFRHVHVVCNALTGTVFYATDIVPASDYAAVERAKADGATERTRMQKGKAIHFEHATDMVSAEAIRSQMLGLTPDERRRVVEARHSYLPSKEAGWSLARKFNSRGQHHERIRLVLA